MRGSGSGRATASRRSGVTAGDASDADVVLTAVPTVIIAIRRALMISFQLSSLLETRRLFHVRLARITGIHRGIIRKLHL